MTYRPICPECGERAITLTLVHHYRSDVSCDECGCESFSPDGGFSEETRAALVTDWEDNASGADVLEAMRRGANAGVPPA